MSDATTVYRLLTASPRRELLFALCETDSIRISAIVTRQDDRQRSGACPDVTGDGGDADVPFELQLYHTHLPKLAETDLVVWDRDAGVVSRGASFPDVRPFVERVRESERELLDRPASDAPPETGPR